MGKPIWTKWANDHDSTQLQAYSVDNSTELRTEKSVKQLQRFGLAATRPAAHPDRDDNTPPAQRAEG